MTSLPSAVDQFGFLILCVIGSFRISSARLCSVQDLYKGSIGISSLNRRRPLDLSLCRLPDEADAENEHAGG